MINYNYHYFILRLYIVHVIVICVVNAVCRLTFQQLKPVCTESEAKIFYPTLFCQFGFIVNWLLEHCYCFSRFNTLTT